MAIELAKLVRVLLVSNALVVGSVLADEVRQVTTPTEAQTSEELAEEEAIKSRSRGGRVIEYGGEVESNSGVMPAVVQEDPMKANPDKAAKETKRNINQKNSVKLITGGDPSDGNAKSGHLPVLD